MICKYFTKEGEYSCDYKYVPWNILHREDGPALISDELYCWSINGERHRVGAPAIIHCDGTEIYFCRNFIHRVDGPAFIDAHHYHWYILGKEYTLEQYCRKLKLPKTRYLELAMIYS